MQQQKINKLVLVLAGGNYKWDRQEISCRETWANPLYYPTDTKVYFVRANTDPCAYDMKMQDINSQSKNPFDATPNWKQHMRQKSLEEIMSASVDVDHITRTIFVDVPDGIIHGSLKLMMAMREISKYYSWNYLTRTHSGSYVNLNLLDQQLKLLPSQKLAYGPPGFTGTYWFASGSCTSFSSDVSDLLIENIKTIISIQLSTAGYEDGLVFGSFINKLGIPVTPSKKIDIDHPKMMVDSSWFDKNCYHYYFIHTKDARPHYIIHKKFYLSENI